MRALSLRALSLRALSLRALLAVTLCVAFAGPLVAQSSRREARALFERGNEAMNEARFAQARDLFRRSLTLFPNAGTAFNLAVALERTGGLVEAVEVFGALADGAYGDISRAQMVEVRRLREEALTGVAELRVQVDEVPGMTVRVDGERREPGALRLNPGEHVVVATAPRHEPREERVVLERGAQQTLRIELELTREATVGVLVLESEDADAVVEIEGVDRGLGRVRAELAPGTYRVAVRNDGRVRWSEAEVTAGSTLRMQLDLERARRPWLWVGLSILAAGAIAAGVGIGVTRDRVDDPVQDDVYGVITTLRAR